MENPNTPKRRRAYKKRGPETWALIRELYLAGATAAQLAERFDVTVWAIRRRATLEGWTKRDHATAAEALVPPRRPKDSPGGAPVGVAAAADDGWDPAGPGPDPATLARRALQGVGAAMAAGALERARTLAQLADVLSRMAASRGPLLDEMAGVDIDTEAAMRDALLERLKARAQALGLGPREDPAREAGWPDGG